LIASARRCWKNPQLKDIEDPDSAHSAGSLPSRVAPGGLRLTIAMHLNSRNGGASFYRFLALGPDEAERCQSGSRHFLLV
jgi:hypothetical protein